MNISANPAIHHTSRAQQQRVEALCAGVMRALTGNAALEYRGQRLHQGTRPLLIRAPHLQPDPARDDFPSFRGVADSIALRLQHSDAALHAQSCPRAPVERLVFELLEQLRVETLAPPDMPGMQQNLQHRFEAWSQAFHLAGLTESAFGILLYTLFQISWSRLNALPVLESTEGVIEATRAAITPLLGHDLAGLRRTRHAQAAYAVHAASIAAIIGTMLGTGTPDSNASRKQRGDDEKTQAAFRLMLDFTVEQAESIPAAPLGASKVLDAAAQAYVIFSTHYDRQADAVTLVRTELLRQYRAELDQCIAQQGINVMRLVRHLTHLLAQPQSDGWSFGEEEGYIDGRRLAQLISSPSERRLFRQEQHKPKADCVVSFLIDCSGSMKAHAQSVAIVIDILVRALERTGAATEVLGFTTSAWNGGRARRDWISARSPATPGRLNERLHMVFKTADATWRRSRSAIAALLKADLYREGIDGEAVDWACTRLRQRAESRRILVVISDGCPMDSATNLANDDFYLANHLKQVVARQSLHGALEICALGVGLDLSPYYQRSLATDLPRGLGQGLLTAIAQMIGTRVRR